MKAFELLKGLYRVIRPLFAESIKDSTNKIDDSVLEILDDVFDFTE